MIPTKSFCSRFLVIVPDHRTLFKTTTAKLAQMMTEEHEERLSEILSGALVAFMVFAMITMVMMELGNYPDFNMGASRPGREISLPDYYSIEETSWK